MGKPQHTGHSSFVRLVSALLCCGMLLGGSIAVAAKRMQTSAAPAAVFTLDEAARFLRLSSGEVASLATQGQLPGRHIGGRWRFSRAALLDWLAGRDVLLPNPASASAGTPVQTPAPTPSLQTPAEAGFRHAADTSRSDRSTAPPQSALSPRSVTHVTGRGTQTPPAQGTAASHAEAETESLGKKPTQETAEEAALRGQRVLLKARQLTLELGLFYTKSEEKSLVLLPTGIDFVPALALGEQDTFTSTFTARYGVLQDLQGVISSALQHQTGRSTVLTMERSDTDTRSGDVLLALRYAAIKEGKGYPDVIFSLEGRIPTAQSLYGLGGGITLVKSLDPVALFAELRYRYTFAQEFSNPSRLQPDSIYSGTLGYAFAFNDSLSFSMAVTGLFTTRTTFRNTVLPARERLSLQLGLTSVLREGLYIEPIVSFALNGPPNVTLGISLPFTFTPW